MVRALGRATTYSSRDSTSRMIIHEKTIDWYIEKLKNNEYFSLAGYSDAEFFCMMGIRIGGSTGLGQKLTREQGEILKEIMQRRQTDPRFMFAIPKCLWEDVKALKWHRIDDWMEANNIEIEAYERDMVTDDLAEAAGLYPFIKQLQQMDVVIIGNRSLRGLEFLHYEKFIQISSPNLHLDPNGVDIVTLKVKEWDVGYSKQAHPVYLVSAGVSAAVIIDRLHDAIPNSWFIDCASIWDAFVGIGGQREWRAKLYRDPKKLEEWKRKNLYGD